MRYSIFTLILAFLVFGCGGNSDAVNATNSGPERIVTIGGSVTETVYALGVGDQIVGTDTSSIYPASVTKLPQVGYQRQLSSEGVVALKPDIVLATSLAGPPPALGQIKSAGIEYASIENSSTVEATRVQISTLARLLRREEQGHALIRKLEDDLVSAKTCATSIKDKPKVLFIHARGAAVVNVGGKKTAGDEMIRLAGGINAIDSFEQYKPLTAETIVSVDPDIILIPERSLESIGGIENLVKLPGISQTKAGKNRRVVAQDDLKLLGFTPRLGEAVKELCRKFQ